MNSRLLSDAIKAEALRLGFFAIGFARAEAVDEPTANALRQWIASGDYAGMEYMANYTDKRLDPRRLMPTVKTIVSVAMNYTPAQTMSEDGYQLASYALGKDYHDIMKQRLRTLAAKFGFVDQLMWEKQKTSEQPHLCRIFVDSGPVLERYWAERAGLGWTGRNHQLIIPHAGSMFFLGELFLDIELPYDRPMPNRCGNCHRCIDACPTHAIEASQAFHSSLCLSYQLIENRGELSTLARNKMGHVIYGCDRCQTACPWNNFAKPNTTPELQPSPELLAMTPRDWQNLTHEQYRQLFKGSAVKRAKYDGLMRNIHAAETADEEKSSRQDPNSEKRKP